MQNLKSPKVVFAGKTTEAYITTVNPPRPGYMVRIPLPGNRYIHKIFRSTDQDLEGLLKSAIAWRDDTYQQHYGEAVPCRVFHKKQASTTGIPGIRKTIKTVKKKLCDGTTTEYKIPCLIAEIWLEPGKDGKKAKKSRSKVYSLNKFTEAEASQLAIIWRQEQERQLRHTPSFLS